jgi:hypothetical protein
MPRVVCPDSVEMLPASVPVRQMCMLPVFSGLTGGKHSGLPDPRVKEQFSSEITTDSRRA